jgi:hypothetical protein
MRVLRTPFQKRRHNSLSATSTTLKQNTRSLATKTPHASNNQRRNNMNLTKSVRGLATDINAAPQMTQMMM